MKAAARTMKELRFVAVFSQGRAMRLKRLSYPMACSTRARPLTGRCAGSSRPGFRGTPVMTASVLLFLTRVISPDNTDYPDLCEDGSMGPSAFYFATVAGRDGTGNVAGSRLGYEPDSCRNAR